MQITATHEPQIFNKFRSAFFFRTFSCASMVTISIGLCRWYINIAITILDINHRPFFYLKLMSISEGLSVPHRNHITSPLRAQQVNVIYRFVTMVY
jgi:hypothetical protein